MVILVLAPGTSARADDSHSTDVSPCTTLGLGKPAYVGTEGEPRLRPRDLSNAERLEMEQLESAIASSGDAAKQAQARFRRARIPYDANRFDMAARGFCEFLENHRFSKQAVPAAFMLFDALNVLHWRSELEASVTHYCAWPQLRKDSSFAETCDSLTLAIERRRAGEMFADGRYREAAKIYLRLANSHSKERAGCEFLHNAAVALELAGESAAATKARKRIIRLRPNDPVCKRAAEDRASGLNPAP